MARFFRRGRSAVKFAPSVAGNSPTRAEITAGLDVTGQVADLAGFNLSNSPIETPDLATTFNSQIKGPDATDTSTLTFYDDDVSSTIRTTMAKDVTGVILLFPYGDISTKRVEKWPVVSTGVNDEWSLDANAARFVIGYAVTSVPFQTGVTPA